MGAGLERFAWITMGTPTAYDCCFGPITQKSIFQQAGIDIEPDLLLVNILLKLQKVIEQSSEHFLRLEKMQYPNQLGFRSA